MSFSVWRQSAQKLAMEGQPIATAPQTALVLALGGGQSAASASRFHLPAAPATSAACLFMFAMTLGLARGGETAQEAA